MVSGLTQKERQTLNAAIAIIGKHTVIGASWQIYASKYRGTEGRFTHDVTYFDSENGQHSLVRGDTFADRVANALSMETRAGKNRERLRADRVASLRKELAELTGEWA